MAITLEQVEKLRAKADISYEEAKAALERSHGDMLDALIELERRGKTGSHCSSVTYTTQPGAPPPPSDNPPPPRAVRREQRRQEHTETGPGFGAQFREWLHAGFNIIKPSTQNLFEIWRHGQQMTSMPILILIIALIAIFWITIPLLIFGLFFGCRYRFSGPDLGRKPINDAMDTVSDTVEEMKDTVRREVNAHRKEKK